MKFFRPLQSAVVVVALAFVFSGCGKDRAAKDQAAINDLIQKGQSGELLRKVENTIREESLNESLHFGIDASLLEKASGYSALKNSEHKKFNTGKKKIRATKLTENPELTSEIKLSRQDVENAELAADEVRLAQEIETQKNLVAASPYLKEALTSDICQSIPDLSVVNNQDAVLESFKQVGSCFRLEFEKIQYLIAAIRYQILIDTKASVRMNPLSESTLVISPLSSMGFADLTSFVSSHLLSPMDTLLAPLDPRGIQLRNTFKDDELSELMLLLGIQERAYYSLGQSIARFFKKRPGMSSMAGKVSDRYEALVGLVPTLEDAPYSYSRYLVNLLVQKFGWGIEALRISDQLVRTYALEALVPLEGQELSPLSEDSEDPLLTSVSKMAFMGGTFELRPQARDYYKGFRNKDNPVFTDHPVAAPTAARVVVFDSGIDFKKVPELGLFLSAGRPGEVGNADYADEDSNPYLPALNSDFGHGTGTSASVLTLFSKLAPQLLLDRKLDLGIWKIDTIRETLAGPFMGNDVFVSRYFPIAEAVIREVYQAQEARKLRIAGKPVDRKIPDIVSVSLGFQLNRLLMKTGYPRVLLDSPWLWVMAAGNESSTVEAENSTCFQDVPAEFRPDARILCVGALKRPELKEDGQSTPIRITNYSNFGKRVDVYAFESYTALCPNGTSCSTPAVAGAAAVLKATYPKLSPEQIKQVIVSAARTLELEVEAGSRAEKTDIVRVFDPETDMPKALALAAKLAI